MVYHVYNTDYNQATFWLTMNYSCHGQTQTLWFFIPTRHHFGALGPLGFAPAYVQIWLFEHASHVGNIFVENLDNV